MEANRRSEPARVGPHRVAIVGAGFGGLFAAKALRRDDVEVTVIDRTNHHLFQPLLYQLATGILAQGDIAPPIRDILRRRSNVHVLLGEVKAIDLDARRLTVDTLGLPSDVPYDSLIIAAGTEQSYFGHPEFAHHAPGMKTIDDALELRGRIFGAFELAEREPDPWAAGGGNVDTRAPAVSFRAHPRAARVGVGRLRDVTGVLAAMLAHGRRLLASR